MTSLYAMQYTYGLWFESCSANIPITLRKTNCIRTDLGGPAKVHDEYLETPQGKLSQDFNANPFDQHSVELMTEAKY